jgi:hypothetical protein
MLVTWPTEFPSSDDTRAAIGIWIIDDSSSPPRPVRLFITYGALWHLPRKKFVMLYRHSISSTKTAISSRQSPATSLMNTGPPMTTFTKAKPSFGFIRPT